MVGLESIRCSNVVVFGKARKLVGGEGSKRPREILPSPNPVDKPPHPLKLSEVLDWTVSYSDPPCLWLVTLRAWYKLVEPSPAYVRVFAPMQRRVAFAAAAAEALRRNWNVRLEDALAFCAERTEVVPGDLLDPKFRVLAASNAAAAELQRKDAEVAARGAGESPQAPRKPATRRRRRGRDRRALALRRARRHRGRRVRRAAAGEPPFVRVSGPRLGAHQATGHRRVRERARGDQEKRSRRGQDGAQSRAESRAESRAARAARGDPAGRGGRRGGSSRPSRAVPSGPREPRLLPPPVPDPAVPESFGATPALVAETLALWDFTQTHGAFLRIPPCPWPRFRRAFLADASETKPSDAALIRDVCVALLRVGEGPVAGFSIAGGEGAAAAAAAAAAPRRSPRPPRRRRRWRIPMICACSTGASASARPWACTPRARRPRPWASWAPGRRRGLRRRSRPARRRRRRRWRPARRARRRRRRSAPRRASRSPRASAAWRATPRR